MNYRFKSRYLVLAASVFGLSLTASLFAASAMQDVPFQGMTQEQVKNVYGEPITAKKPVGKPPITRWDYENYSVYFEGNQVIHAFLHEHRLKAHSPAAPAAQTGSMTMPTQEQPEVTEMEVEEAGAEVEADMQAVEESMEAEKQATHKLAEGQKEEITVEEVAVPEKDLNYEETPKSDFGKWGY